MLSSKVQEIKEGTQEVADDIAARTKATAADISTETRETLDNLSDRVGKEGTEIKSEIELLLGKVYDLLRPETTYEVRQQVRQSLDNVTRKVADWAEGREGELTARLDTTRLHTRKTDYEHPMSSLLVAAGAGALVTYWLMHRSPDSDQPR
jgi:predicted DNA-binding protein